MSELDCALSYAVNVLSSWLNLRHREIPENDPLSKLLDYLCQVKRIGETIEPPKLEAAEKLANRVLAYLQQPNGLPPSSNMECDCELYFLATDFLDAQSTTEQADASRDHPVREALKPFSDLIDCIEGTTSHEYADTDTWEVPIGWLRRARETLSLSPTSSNAG